MNHRIARGLLLAVTAAALGGAARAQDKWPSRPVRLISTSVAGGNIHLICRIIAEKLSVRLAQPVSYGSIGVGPSLHLFGVILEKEYGVPLNHAPYKGEVQATADVMNGALDVAWVSILIAKPLAAAGRVRALAITGPKRFVAWPERATC